MSRTSEEESVVTKEMIGLFVAFGGDIILLVVLLAAVGAVSWTVALGISGIILIVFGTWVGHRWWRLRRGTQRETTAQETETPLDTLKARYAAGELSDEEFEAKLDQLLESERRDTHSEEQKAVVTTDDETIEDRH